MRHRNRERHKRSIQRRPPRVSPGESILIVCEGAKTEPTYFTGLRREWRLYTSQVEVVGEACGSAPISVVNHALELRKERTRQSEDGWSPKYDQVWCVFDREGVKEHPSFKPAVNKANANALDVAVSCPCFELWYLLHFVYTTRPFAECSQVISMLANHLDNYKKNKDVTRNLLPKLAEALKNAAHVRRDNLKTGRECPSTDVDKLVDKLQSMKRDL